MRDKHQSDLTWLNHISESIMVTQMEIESIECPDRGQGGFVLHGFLNPPNEITAGLDILPAL